MDPNKLTQKTIEALNNAQEAAVENGHQLVTPVHLALALLEDPEGIAHRAVQQSGNDETYRC